MSRPLSQSLEGFQASPGQVRALISVTPRRRGARGQPIWAVELFLLGLRQPRGPGRARMMSNWVLASK